MTTQFKFYKLVLIFFVVMGLGLAGCAEGSEDAASECSDDFDCGFGESCDIPNGVCRSIDLQDPTTRPALPECTSNAGCAYGQQCNDEGKCEADPTSNNDPNPDNNTPGNNTPGACDPVCQSGETCEEGVCVA